jgi:hypothetical protein
MKLSLLAAGLFSALSVTSAFEIEDTKDCVLIEDTDEPSDDHLFHYQQNDENLDPNKLYLLVHKIVFSRLDGVKKITLDYSKINIHHQHKIGDHFLTAEVQQQKSGTISSHCYQLKYTVHDVNECTNTDASKGRKWVSQCDASAVCENTVGSYNCLCPGEYFGTRNAGGGKCSGLLTTEHCCGEDITCKADFACHNDHCTGNKCDPMATCSPGTMPNEYTCECKEDYVGNGFTCEFVNYCKDENDNTKCPRGCQCISHADRDGYTCPPKPGFTDYTPPLHQWEQNPTVDPNRLDPTNHICVDDEVPTVLLLGEKNQVLTQGDVYTEMGLHIEDVNTALLKRSYTTDYSDAMYIMDPSGVKPCGSNEIHYSLSTPWLKERPNITITRSVEVVDVNECTYKGPVTEFHHACVEPAVCQNMVCEEGDKQSYSCTCPYHDYEEDGHTHGCKDERAPVIRCKEFGCDEITLWALKMDAVIQKSKDGESTLLASNNYIDPSWVHGQLQQIYKEGFAVDAYDLLWDETIVDLTSEIQQHELEVYDDAKNIWALPFSVKDEVGNTGHFSIHIHVKFVDSEVLLAHFQSSCATAVVPDCGSAKPSMFSGGSSGGDAKSSVSRFQLSFHIFVILGAFYYGFYAVGRLLRAGQCLLAPKTLMNAPKSYESGMHLLLFVQSLGRLDEAERAKIIQSQWDDLQDGN